MSGGANDREQVKKTRNVARYFAEQKQVGWFLLVITLLAGIIAYVAMPKRKDPFIKVRVAVAICVWPGAPSEKVEELVSRRIEEKIAQNADVERIETSSRTGVSLVTVALRDDLPLEMIAKTFDDIDLKLRSIRDLPQGAFPIEFQKDFGDTAALMLTVTSPRARPVEIAVRAKAVGQALGAARASLPASSVRTGRSALVMSFPASLNTTPLHRVAQAFSAFAQASGRVSDLRVFDGGGFMGVDGAVQDPNAWSSLFVAFAKEQVSTYFHPEVWRPIVIERPEDAEAALAANAGHAYTYRELDEYTERMARQLRGLPSVAKVTRAGVLDERIYLDYSQERLSALGLSPLTLRDAIVGRNTQSAGGIVDAHGRTLAIQATGEYQSEKDLADTLLTVPNGTPVYLRDVVDVVRDYESPPGYLNFHTWRTHSNEEQEGASPTAAKQPDFERTRAITLAIQMRTGEQIATFSEQVDTALADLEKTLPEDLIISRTSDQPRQVEEKVSLFMRSLYEAIIIIVIVALVGFREWRSALLLALSIPLTLAMTFVFMAALGIDIQQISIAALILALGLLVDDPVVAGDAIKQELENGQSRVIAAWLGPTKLAHAILYATITNIVAYLPFLLMKGDVGHFIYSLPIVLACSLVASRIVSMTFIPLLARVILRHQEKKKTSAFLMAYRGFVKRCIDHRYKVLGASLIVLLAGGVAGTRLRSSFFPQDYSRLFYVDISLPEDASIRATRDATEEADRVIRDVGDAYAASKAKKGKKPPSVIHSLTAFIGGGAPRFWYSLSPQLRALNYAQIVVEVEDEHDTSKLIEPLQNALTSRVPGARIDVRQLENGKPVPRPVEVRFSGDDTAMLRGIADRAKSIFREIDIAERVRDDWGEDSFRVLIDIDGAKAGLAGVSNQEVAVASLAGFSGLPLGTLREGEHAIPIVARLRYEERGNAGDINDLYVLGLRSQKVPLGQVANVSFKYALEKVARRNQRHTISVSCFPGAGVLPLEVMKVAKPKLEALKQSLPPGYAMEIGGAEENVVKVRKESGLVAGVSLLAIFLTLVLQFKHALKPVIVFATIPYGVSGAVIAIVVMGAPFGFTAILGTISLIGVIVSHVIVLFDYIEESHEKGEPLEQALLDAGTQRLRPVLITVGATVLGLVPLALHGGPLWEPLCYAQIGGLTLATGITLVLVPTLYAVVVLDLKWLRWSTDADPTLHVSDSMAMPIAKLLDIKRRLTSRR
jgi:multidrug efflux pump subunit AcrB